jgi:hypothetical protein
VSSEVLLSSTLGPYGHLLRRNRVGLKLYPRQHRALLAALPTHVSNFNQRVRYGVAAVGVLVASNIVREVFYVSNATYGVLGVKDRMKSIYYLLQAKHTPLDS